MDLDKLNEKYEVFKNALIKAGFKVEFKKQENHIAYYIDGKGVNGCYCTYIHDNCEIHNSINGALSADNEKCFDKWSKCPICMLAVPITDREINYVIEKLLFLGSNEGFKLSNNYEMDYISDYRELKESTYAEKMIIGISEVLDDVTGEKPLDGKYNNKGKKSS